MATPNKIALLQLITNPLMREILEPQVEKIIANKKDSAAFVSAAKSVNENLKDPPMGMTVDEYAIKTKKILSRETTQNHHIDESALKKFDEASEEEKHFGKKVAFIQSLFDRKQPITESSISQAFNTSSSIDAKRVQFAVDNVKTKAHPEPLIHKIKNFIDKDFSDEKLLALQALQDYVRIENRYAKEGDLKKPFSQNLEASLNHQIESLEKLKSLREDLVTFEKSIKASTPEKKTNRAGSLAAVSKIEVELHQEDRVLFKPK